MLMEGRDGTLYSNIATTVANICKISQKSTTEQRNDSSVRKKMGVTANCAL